MSDLVVNPEDRFSRVEAQLQSWFLVKDQVHMYKTHISERTCPLSFILE